ncbi:MAG: zinc-ribbon domain-containing protein [Proteobacteria bacterium]|nr:zinc-ribbon domain-containing protein [Pseudomonadota bacterium]
MILVCPNCAARYEVDGAQFPAEGRKVRCKKCGHAWHQAPEAGQAEIEEAIFNPPKEPEPVAVPEPEIEAEAPQPSWRAPVLEEDAENDAAEDFHPDEPEVARPAAHGRGTALVMLGWAALVAVVLVIGWSAANYRSQIVGIWPQSASLFSKLGMAVNTRGLDFADVRHTSQTEDGQPVLVITGKVVNVTGKKLDVPPLRVTLSDANKHGIYGWTFTPSATALAPGQSVAFRTRLSNPPSAARHVELRFADGAE